MISFAVSRFFLFIISILKSRPDLWCLFFSFSTENEDSSFLPVFCTLSLLFAFQPLCPPPPNLYPCIRKRIKKELKMFCALCCFVLGCIIKKNRLHRHVFLYLILFCAFRNIDNNLKALNSFSIYFCQNNRTSCGNHQLRHGNISFSGLLRSNTYDNNIKYMNSYSNGIGFWTNITKAAAVKHKNIIYNSSSISLAWMKRNINCCYEELSLSFECSHSSEKKRKSKRRKNPWSIYILIKYLYKYL